MVLRAMEDGGRRTGKEKRVRESEKRGGENICWASLGRVRLEVGSPMGGALPGAPLFANETRLL